MRAAAVAARVEVPPHVLHRDVELLDAAHQLVVVLLAHRATNDLANLREEHVGALHGETREALLLAGLDRLVVQLHVEGLDLLRVVDHDDGLLEVLLHQVAFVLGGQVDAPADGELEFVAFGDGLFIDYTRVNGDYGVVYGDLYAGRLPSYHRMDISGKRKFSIGKRSILEVNVSITNVYNRNNIFYFDRLTFDRVDQLPIMWSTGLNFRF